MRPSFVAFGVVAALAAPAFAQEAPPDSEPVPVPVPAPVPDLEPLKAHIAELESRIAGLEARPALAPVDSGAATTPPDDATGFRFGSYGRILAGTDLRGGRPEPIAVVARGPRVVEKSYLELDFAYGMRARESGALLRTVVTLAFGDRLFHETGEFDAQPALRNFFAEASFGSGDDGTTLWVGSRMYRGDDIYLFDYWPLDDQNTLGAGALTRKGAVEVAAHAGVNRLLDDYQFQERDVASPELGATTVTQLDRQRMVGSASATYYVAGAPSDLNAKIKLHAELQGLPSGTRLRDDATPEALPRDWGTTLGAQLGVWGLADPSLGYRRHANVFARYSKGLAAFDELAPPFGFDTTLRTYPRASELVVGLGANWDDRWGHVLFGTYARRFVDADPNVRDIDDGWEYAANVRPMAFVYKGVFAGVDLAYQARFPRGLMPSTQVAEDPAVVSFAPMLAFSPMGRSGYDRPQLRLVYRVAKLSDGALALYPEDDPRRAHSTVHYLGAQAEWWFNSNSYR
ncbi:MAG TPA: carbohydrate porin [Kofleriaceae bacterium]|nr:carbohydrate porin [Kofleriaceae bacterium]